MKKVGVLFLVIAIGLFGCEKKNSPDEDFQIYVEELQNDLGIVILEKNEKEVFHPIELLEKDTGIDFNYLIQKVFGIPIPPLFPESQIYERNNSIVKGIQMYLIFKSQVLENGVSQDSMVTFSIINVLRVEVENENYSPEEQFLQIISRLDEIPVYFTKAKELIQKPTKENLENAIQQYSQDYFYLKNELPLLLRKPDILKEDQIDFSQKNEQAQLAVKDFIAFLNSQLFEINDK